MATPTIKIPIDDEAFKRFFETFKKYQDALEEQPEIWKGINNVIGSVASAGAAVAAEIAHQGEETRKLTQEEAKRKQAQQEAAKASREAAKERQDEAKEEEAAFKEKYRREKESEKESDRRAKEGEVRRKREAREIKEFTGTLVESAAVLGKWAILGGGAGIVTGALGLWGADKFVQGVGSEFRLSQGLGINNIGQREAYATAFQRYFDVNTALGNVANMRANPSQWGAFAMLGLNPQGPEDNPSLMGNVASAARRMFIGDKGNLMLAQAQGLTKFFAPEDLRRMAETPDNQWAQSQSNAAALAKLATLSPNVGLKWQNFNFELEKAGLALKNEFIKKITDFDKNGELDKLVKKLGQVGITLVDKLFSPENVKKIEDGLDVFANYIGSKKFDQDLNTIVTDIGLVAKKIVDALVLLGVIPSPANSAAAANAPGGVPNAGTAGLPSGKGGFNYKAGAVGGVVGFAVGGPVGAAIGALGAGEGLGRVGTGVYRINAEQYAAKQLIAWGWSENQAMGIIQNNQDESRFNPFAVEKDTFGRPILDKKTGQYRGYGIAQWDPARRKLYDSLFGHSMQSVSDPAQALREQLEFEQWELTSSDPRNKFKKAGDDLKAESSRYGSAYTFSSEFERPTGGRATASLRGVEATVNVSVDFHPKKGPSTARIANAAAGG